MLQHRSRSDNMKEPRGAPSKETHDLKVSDPIKAMAESPSTERSSKQS